jgi:hypothetical protein
LGSAIDLQADTTPAVNRVRDCAIEYSDLSYAVIPIVCNEKRPATEHGLRDASTDEFQIESWWADQPNANVAIVTDGLLVLDRDVDKETGKITPWPEDEGRRADLFRGPVATTPRGGMHHWFRMPNGQKAVNSTGKLAPQVDTRANGGYVLVYPSVVDGKPYSWLESNQLCKPDQLPVAPQWLLDGLSERKSSSVVVAVSEGIIPEGSRNAMLASIAGHLVRIGRSHRQVEALLLEANDEQCKPPLSIDEVKKIAWSISRKEPDQIATMIAEGCSSGITQAGKFSLNLITSEEFSRKEYTRHYLVKNILVQGQPCMMAGMHKTLKTTQMIDLALSLGTGRCFLNHPAFEVVSPVAVAVISGESGGFTMKETAIRIAESKGIDLATSGVFWGFDLPQISRPDHLAALRQMIIDHGLKVVFIDPAYLCLMGGDTQGRNAGNVFDMGSILMGLTNVGQQTGCTMVLLHHMRKNLANPYAQPELHDMSFAGFAEWARQWLLIGRRSRYDQGSGIHDLWLNAGGSSGHSGMFAVNIDEGTFCDEFDSRKWCVSVASAGEAIQAEKAQKRADRESLENIKLSSGAKSVLKELSDYPDGRTLRDLRTTCKLQPDDIKTIVENLRNNRSIQDCKVKGGNGQSYDAIRLNEVSG